MVVSLISNTIQSSKYFNLESYWLVASLMLIFIVKMFLKNNNVKLYRFGALLM